MAIVNKAAMNRGAYILLNWYFGILRTFLEVKSLGQKAVPFLTFLRKFHVGGFCPQGPLHHQAQMRISLPRRDLLQRRAKSLFLNGLLLGSICTGIQIKLINHCQAVKIDNKQRTLRAYAESGSVS